MDAERKAIDLLLEKGIRISIPRRSPLKRFGKKERTFLIKQPPAGILLRMSSIALDTDFSEANIQNDPYGESCRLVVKNTRRMGRYVAIAICSGIWCGRILEWPLSLYLLKRINPSVLYNLCLTIRTLSNYGDFMNSIRLIFAPRISQKMEKVNLSPIDNGG